MKDLNQQIIKFNYDKSLKDDDFYVSNSNNHILKFLNNWPRCEKNFFNINGEKFSGKTHLINIFQKKFGGIIVDSKNLNDDSLNKIKLYQNIILENLEKNVDEKLLFTLINFIEQDNKYLIVTSKKPIVDIRFNLNEFTSSLFDAFIFFSNTKPSKP